jgi:uncharacterized membrane protein YeaQ/YmgE (transglycosylase-associated protein family)
MTIILGGLAGWIAEKIMKADMGLIANIIVGILGAVILNAILGLLGIIPPGGWLWQCIIAIIGACILIWIYRAVRGRS